MGNKPDKFDIRLSILADLNTKYCVNIIPYRGKDERSMQNFGTQVVIKLMEQYFGRGYNDNTDLYTSFDLENFLN